MVEYTFQAEINQLMHLIINSFYSNREIFLRELVSNASDAIDKHRHTVLESGNSSNERYHIRISPDMEKKQLRIEDNGIGMSRQELIDNLGTIARSGTKAFIEKQKDVNLIGQFGVGFYSAFLIADNVQVTSTHDGETHMWESSATGSFTITPVDTSSTTHGTTIVMHVKDDQHEFLDERRIRELVRKHNQFITHPIELLVKQPVTSRVDEGNVDADVDVPVFEFEHINTEPPIWTKQAKDITKEEYTSFYKTISGDFQEPLAYKHFSVEGQLEYKGIIFIPRNAPFDMFENRKQKSLKLHVRKVFVTDESEFIVPEWLSFIKGVVDSNDLPLNISREYLQHNRVLQTIQKTIVKKAIELFSELNDEDGKVFYSQFSKNIKLAAYQDQKIRDKLMSIMKYDSLLLFRPQTIAEYIDEMNKNNSELEDTDKQSDLYYMCGENVDAMRSSPFVEKCVSIGVNVIFMTDPIDEYIMQQVKDYTHEDKKYTFVCMSKEKVMLPTKQVSVDEDTTAFCETLKAALDGRVDDVVVSSRLVSSPCCVVTGEHGWTANMERILKSQALRVENGVSDMMKAKRILEIHPTHALIQKLKKDDTDLEKMLMCDTAMLASGFSVQNPCSLASRIFSQMTDQ